MRALREENGNEGKVTETKEKNVRKNNENALVTRESLGAVGALFSALAFLILVTRSLIFGGIGAAVDSFLLGVFGYAAYVAIPALFVASLSAFLGKRFFKKRGAVISVLLTLFCILLLVHAGATLRWEREGYFSVCFNAAENGVKTCAPAGWLGGLIVGALFAVAGNVGAFLILSVVLLLLLTLNVRCFTGKSVFAAIAYSLKKDKNGKNAQNTQNQTNDAQSGYAQQPYMQSQYAQPQNGGYAQNPAGGSNADIRNTGYSPDGARYRGESVYGNEFSRNSFEGDPSANGYGNGADYGQGANYPNYPVNGNDYSDPSAESAYGNSSVGGTYEKYNEYGFPADNVRQRPGVTLSRNPDGYAASGQAGGYAPSSFSPFGAPNGAGNANAGASGNVGQNAAQSGNNAVYGSDPVESFRNNLIFDPTSKFNRRKSAANEPVSAAPVFRPEQAKPAAAPPQPSGNRNSSAFGSFGTSYTDSYADSINGRNSADRIVNDKRREETPFNAYQREVSDFGGTENRDLGTSSDRAGFGGTGRNDVSGGVSAERGFNAETNRNEDVRSGENSALFGNTENEQSRGGIADDSFTVRDMPPRETDSRFDTARGDNGNADLFGDNLRASSGRDSDFTENTRSDRGGDDLTIFDDNDENEDIYPLGGEAGRRDNDDDLPPFDGGREFTAGRDFTANRGETQGRDLPDTRENGGRFGGSREMPSARNLPESNARGGDMRNTSAPVPPVPAPVPKIVPEKKPEPPKPRRPFRSAPLDYFDCTDTIPDANNAEIDENKQTILDTLEAFKVPDASIASVTCGPTVTRYNVAVPRYISPKKVVALDQPIAMNLHAANGVNIAPNFEDGTISVEVPNRKRQTVTLGSMLVADEYINAKPNALIFAMGKNVGNKKMYGDIRKMTHILVAGTSGSGKTAFLHSVIISLIMKYSPADLRLILIDPKKTEFVVYEGLPHLVINEVLSDTNKVIQSLNWAIAEMERRYDLFNKKSRSGTYVINIDEYNANLTEGEEKLPKIVIIADEVAAMMQDAKKDMEDRIQNLTQKSRATGIHVILATQRPSTDVITGVIKSNLKSRIALSVASEIDSRVILDESGAQNLLGQGDLLYSTEGTKTPIRMQAPFISSEKAQEVIRYIKENNDCYFNEAAAEFIDKPKGQSGSGDGASGDDDAVDEVYVEALRNAILSNSASISLVQRKCSVGYNKAGKIIEWMEDQGYISAFDGAKARKVLITPEQFEEKFGPL